jgi:glycosyltransferase involved in cell wall biosynthesis
MKICVITSRFGLSGVPLAQLKFARALTSIGHEVDYIVGYMNEGTKLPIINNIEVYIFNKKRVLFMLFSFIKYLKKESPDVIFTAGDHLNCVILFALIITRSKAKISASSRVTPYDTYSRVPLTKRWILKQIMKIVSYRANALTCVSRDMIKQYQTVFKKSKHLCVYNIVNDESSKKMMKDVVVDKRFSNSKYPIIVAAGMLEPWKGFSDLINAINFLSKTTKVKLFIFGDGSLRDELQDQINLLELNDRVILYGNVENPLKYFCHADVFVLSSYVEGLPNVLVEAMMCGCTPVATDCPTGPKEVLSNGKYGYLVPVNDPIEMSKAIYSAIKNPIPKVLLEEAIKPFSEQEVINKHFKILGFE